MQKRGYTLALKPKVVQNRVRHLKVVQQQGVMSSNFILKKLEELPTE